jgi:hypothetical protein
MDDNNTCRAVVMHVLNQAAAAATVQAQRPAAAEARRSLAPNWLVKHAQIKPGAGHVRHAHTRMMSAAWLCDWTDDDLGFSSSSSSSSSVVVLLDVVVVVVVTGDDESGLVC